MAKFIHTNIASMDEEDEKLEDMGLPIEEKWIPYSFRIEDVETFYPCIRENEGEVGTVINFVMGNIVTANIKYEEMIKLVDAHDAKQVFLNSSPLN